MDEVQNNIEEWRPIPEWEGIYEASNHGNIRRLHKHTIPRIVKARLNRFGYFEIGLKRWTQPRQTWIFVHRLIASAFIGPLPVGHQVDHRDGHKQNNTPSNLEYVTPRENIIRGHRLGLMNPPRGERVGSAKVTDEVVRIIRASADPYSKISKQWGISIGTISAMRNRKTWKHVE